MRADPTAEQPRRPANGWRKVLANHPLAATALLFGALSALFYAPVLLGLRSFPDGDFTHHFLPFSIFQQQELLAGRLAVWNPYTYAGHPFLADVQAAVFYPLSNLLLALTLPWTDAGARLYFLQVEAVLHVALAGLFTYVLVYELTRSRWGGLAAGTAFAFSGYLSGYPPAQLAVLRTAIWLPLLLFLLLRIVQMPGQWRWPLAGGVTLAVAFLAGHSQTFLFLAYAAGAWTVLLMAARWRTLGWSERGQMFLSLCAAALLALGLSAAQLLPSVEFAGLSVRANVDYAFVAGGFPLQDTWQLLLPAVLTVYSPLYVGVIGLGLAFLGTSFVLQRGGHASQDGHWFLSPRAGAAFFLGISAVALLLSYGSNGFLYALFYSFAPGWNLFRGQERAAYLVAFGLAALGGYGALAVEVMPQRRRAWWATVFAALVIAGVYVFGLLWQLGGRTAIGEGQFLLIAALTVTLASVFAVMLRTGGWSRARWQWLLGLAAANLFVVSMGTNAAEGGPLRRVLLSPEVAAVQSARTQASEEASAEDTLGGRVYNEFRAYEDYGMRAGVQDVWGSSPLRLARYAALFEEFPLDRMWRLLGVEHVLTWRKELFGPSELLGEFPQATDTTYLHRLEEQHLRGWLVSQAWQADDEETLALLADHQFDLDAVALLPTGQSAEGLRLEGEPLPPSASVQLQSSAPGHLHVAVQDSPGALAVIAENWMPGWRVENVTCTAECTDVAPLGLTAFVPQRADLTLLGVPIPPGSYQFDLFYRPDSIRLGLWISGITLTLLGSLALWRLFVQKNVRRTKSAGQETVAPDAVRLSHRAAQ
jgi:hypothetical protein